MRPPLANKCKEQDAIFVVVVLTDTPAPQPLSCHNGTKARAAVVQRSIVYETTRERTGLQERRARGEELLIEGAHPAGGTQSTVDDRPGAIHYDSSLPFIAVFITKKKTPSASRTRALRIQ
ncbi:hypothetical protein EVAR_19954_1 [Eumeta japonica]|uniref:Uncharacterized protein n=1 Tax=Eumeta variegata TaxID=151549 RepID=A0A4C1YLT4_EUMVA|nr:hypothetical protein EVAR_19954_1 [Eumeta japonica]